MTTDSVSPAPTPLVVAATVTGLEGLFIIALAVLEAASLSGERVVMGLTTTLFFAAYGATLMACGWLITRGHTLARGPILLAQLIQLGIAWNLRSEGSALIAPAAAVVALIVLVGMLHPATTAVLNPEAQIERD